MTTLEAGYADVVIINSVVQYFNNFEEYKKVIDNLSKLIRNGILFVGDILDLDKKNSFLDEIDNYGGKANRDDQWYSKADIGSVKNANIKNVLITDKIGYTIQNELTKYRFDAIYEIQR